VHFCDLGVCVCDHVACSVIGVLNGKFGLFVELESQKGGYKQCAATTDRRREIE
jgi:hypothetical protein